MGAILNKYIDFMRDESGVSAMEYALIAALIAIVIISAVAIVGTTLQGLYTNVASKL